MTVRVAPRPRLFDTSLEALAPDPGERRARLRLPYLFLAVFVVPVLAACVYYFFIATPMYVSEASFIVKAPSQAQTVGLSGILQGVGIGQTQDQTFAVHEYMTSRDAITDLQRRVGLRALLDRPGADFFARFPRPGQSASTEELYNAYKRFVTVGHDSTTGISTLRVTLFRPGDARAVASALLDGGEALVNRLNDRAMHDAVAASETQVLEAEGQVAQAEEALTAYRSRERLIDPTKSSTAELDLSTKLSEELGALQAERSGLAASAPQDPQLPALDSRIRGYQHQLDLQNAKMAGEADSLAPKIGAYEELDLRREFAGKLLASATASLESARQEARRKQLYLERIVNPDLPDQTTRPHRLASIAVIAVSALLAYGILLLIIAGLKEHRQH